jgi:PIN domain nuclease of toxin-antitoxin system
LSAAAQTALADPANELFLSAASVWELAIKIGNNKLTLRDPLDVFVTKWTVTYQLTPVPIETPHALTVVGLPQHHKDPFDRILIAQTAVEKMTLVSGDNRFTAYGVPIPW